MIGANELMERVKRARRWAWYTVLRTTRAHRTLWIGVSNVITTVALLALAAKVT